MSEWVFMLSRQLNNFLTISWREQVNVQWDDTEFRTVLEQHAF